MPVPRTSGKGDVPVAPVVGDSTNHAWIMTQSLQARFNRMGVRNHGEAARLHLQFHAILPMFQGFAIPPWGLCPGNAMLYGRALQ